MGIEGFYNTIRVRKNSGITNQFVNKTTANYLYIDFNSILHIIHKQTKTEMDYILYYLVSHDKKEDKENKDKDNELIKGYAIEWGFDINNASIKDYNQFFTPELINKHVRTLTISYIQTLIKTYTDSNSLKLVYIAFDGIPNMGKIIEQKHRKYMGYVQSGLTKKIYEKYKNSLSEKRQLFEENAKSFDRSNLVTWSSFMKLMLDEIKDTAWVKTLHNYKFELKVSGSDYPGEGEKKIMEEIKIDIEGQKEGNYLLYSPDADVVLLSIVLNNISHLYNKNNKMFFDVLHYDQQENENSLCDIDKFSTYICELVKLEDMKKSLNIMNDFVLIATLFGNDFVPKIYSINIKKEFENILYVYAELVKNNQFLVIPGVNITSAFSINHENLVIFLKQVCNIEYKMHRNIFRMDLENNNNKFMDKRFIKDYIKENPIRQHLIDMNKGQLTEYDENIIKMMRKFVDYEDMLGSNIKSEQSFESYLSNYYPSYLGVKTREEINMVNREYLNGLFWTFDFYFNKNDSEYNYKYISTWFYRYDRAPLLADITRSLRYFVDKKMTGQFTNNINKTLVERKSFMTRHGQMLYTLPINEIKTKYHIEGLDELYKDPYFVDMEKYVDDIWNKKNNMLDCRRISFLNKCNLVQVPNHSFPKFMNILNKYPNYMNIIAKFTNYI